MNRWRTSERGSVSLEAALLAPGLIALMLVVVYAGRISQAEAQVRSAATAAARAASVTGGPEAAAAAAEETAAESLATAGVACHTREITVDTDELTPGDTVRVTVACTTSLKDLTLLGVPGARTLTATSTAPIDTYRAGQ